MRQLVYISILTGFLVWAPELFAQSTPTELQETSVKKIAPSLQIGVWRLAHAGQVIKAGARWQDVVFKHSKYPHLITAKQATYSNKVLILSGHVRMHLPNAVVAGAQAKIRLNTSAQVVVYAQKKYMAYWLGHGQKLNAQRITIDTILPTPSIKLVKVGVKHSIHIPLKTRRLRWLV